MSLSLEDLARWRARADTLADQVRVRAALRRDLDPGELTPEEYEHYLDLVVLMEPSPEAVAYFEELRKAGGVGYDDAGNFVRLPGEDKGNDDPGQE